ncbi:copper homeostasis protein CutC [Gracilibacillus alcaliphilus]|uniref:copper homeostasis protein CutC n=1 Tax=Gracilibacillus alcaliphilus TaxID=1401441 RepID=UPI00195EB76A|nr:copper homeostasis protein CutC [Gracilibacillus alcaliphilus]MBM7676298.1 copper homeostasis protein [Gracilibacillus alcaliphilus]
MLIEVIALTKQDVIEAEKQGYDRVELVSSIDQDGLTPDLELVQSIMEEKLSIPVQVMIRPHDKGFYYNEEDTQVILNSFQEMYKLGVRRFVFGALNQDNTVDEVMLQDIQDIADDIRITFHRAIDFSKDIEVSYQVIAKYPKLIERVLTSGGEPTCTAGKETIKRLLQLSEQWNGPVVMPGSGITLTNLLPFHEEVQAGEYHVGKGVRHDQSYHNRFVSRPAEWK